MNNGRFWEKKTFQPDLHHRFFLNKFNSYWSVNSVNRQEAKKKSFQYFSTFAPQGADHRFKFWLDCLYTIYTWKCLCLDVIVAVGVMWLKTELFLCRSRSHFGNGVTFMVRFTAKSLDLLSFLFSSLLLVVRSCACGWGWKWQFWTSCFQAGVLNDRLTLKELSPKLSCLTGGDGSSGEKG